MFELFATIVFTDLYLVTKWWVHSWRASWAAPFLLLCYHTSNTKHYISSPNKREINRKTSTRLTLNTSIGIDNFSNVFCLRIYPKLYTNIVWMLIVTRWLNVSIKCTELSMVFIHIVYSTDPYFSHLVN